MNLAEIDAKSRRALELAEQIGAARAAGVDASALESALHAELSALGRFGREQTDIVGLVGGMLNEVVSVIESLAPPKPVAVAGGVAAKMPTPGARDVIVQALVEVGAFTEKNWQAALMLGMALRERFGMEANRACRAAAVAIAGGFTFTGDALLIAAVQECVGNITSGLDARDAVEAIDAVPGLRARLESGGPMEPSSREAVQAAMRAVQGAA